MIISPTRRPVRLIIVAVSQIELPPHENEIRVPSMSSYCRCPSPLPSGGCHSCVPGCEDEFDLAWYLYNVPRYISGGNGAEISQLCDDLGEPSPVALDCHDSSTSNDLGSTIAISGMLQNTRACGQYGRRSGSTAPSRDFLPAVSDGLGSPSGQSATTAYAASTTSDSPPVETISSPTVDTLLPTPITENSVSPPSSTQEPEPDQSVVFPCDYCDGHFVGVDQYISHIESSHPEYRYCCKKCNYRFVLRRNFRRHLQTTKAHMSSSFRCRCERVYSRKDHFRNHLQSKKPCEGDEPYLCSCKLSMESKGPDSADMIKQHIKGCGSGKPGRPKK